MTTKLYGADKPSLEDLEHFGVPGMRWGVRRSSTGKTNHQLNKASRAKDKAQTRAEIAKENAQRDAAIEKARVRLSSGKTQADFKAAKRAHKSNKNELGTREARKKLNAAREKRDVDIHNANLIKSGAEATGHMIGTVGAVVLVGAASAAIGNRRL